MCALALPLFPMVSKMADASASQESFIEKNLSNGLPITVQNRAEDAANVVDNIMSQQAETLDETFPRKSEYLNTGLHGLTLPHGREKVPGFMPSVSLSEPLDQDFMSIDNAINTSVVSSVTNVFDNSVLSVFSETKGNSQSDGIPTPGSFEAQSSRPLGDYKIPKKTQRKLSAVKETTDVSLEGFDSEEDEDQWFDDEDDMDDHDDFNGEELPKTQRKQELSSDESDSDLADGDFACLDPAGKKKRRLQTVQKSYVKKMFSKLAEDLDESLEKIGVEVPNDPRLTSKGLDQNLLDTLPFNTKKFVVRSDNTLKRIEYRLLRATGPSLTLWNKLKDARDAKKSKVNISKLITLVEVSVCTIGQAELELKFQRRLQMATKFLQNPKKAKKVITLNHDILEGEKSQLFGNVFTKKLAGNLKDTAKLRIALREATSRPRFDGGYNSRGRASGGYNQWGRGGSPQQQPFCGGPCGGRRGGGGRGRGRGGAQTSNRYVQTVYSKVKRSFSECKSKKSSKKRSGFRNRFINSCVFHYCSESSDTVTQRGPDPCSGGKQVRGQTVSLHPELADCNSRSVDSGSSRGKTNLVVRNTLSKQNTQRAKLQPSDEPSNENRNSVNARLWSNRGMSGLKPTIHKHNISEVQERWGVSSNFQLEKAQPVHGIPAFQVRGIPALVDTVKQMGWMYKIDLKNAYWTVPLHPKDRRWFRFTWEKLYQFKVWPFGLGPMPRWFTKLMKPVVGLLRRLGMRNVIYMDDLWGGDQTMEEVAFQAVLTRKLLEYLGFVVNEEKSVISPQRTVEYLGFIVDSEHMTLMLPRQKILKIPQACKDLLNKHKTSVREVAKIVGQLVEAARAVLTALVHYRQLQMAQMAQMILSNESREELQW